MIYFCEMLRFLDGKLIFMERLFLKIYKNDTFSYGNRVFIIL